MLFSFKALDWVRKQHSKYRDNHSFVKYAEFHSIAVLYHSGVRRLEDLDNPASKTKYDEILKATARIVKEDREESKEKYSHRILFINSVTLGRIQEAMTKRKG